MDNLIEIKNLCFSYTDTENIDGAVLDDVNLDIHKGEFLCIVGHNGSGKSTLAKMLNGLLKPDSGEVLVKGISTQNEQKLIDIRKTVGMVFQNPDNQIIASVVEEDVAFGPENLGCSPQESRRRVDSALSAVDMFDFKSASPYKLSGGQKQRVAIAGVLAMEPECIVFDESTAMLDPKGRAEVLDTVNKLNKEKGITVVFITHFMEEARFADRLCIMDNGKILKTDTPYNIFSDYELIEKTGLTLPEPMKLIKLLNDNGIKVSGKILDEDDAAQAISRLLKGGAEL
ncbi:MAG: energy-coupling factor transporter ATPase [Oscillospiraceae bacterium]|nr:energy-coupling factor transporter ATPase [Candidatus Equicaccousia limihippi]